MTAVPAGRETELRYEDLRQEVLEGSLGHGAGLALFLRRGMASWMQALAGCAASVPAGERVRRAVLPAGTRPDVVRILAGMALGHGREQRA